MYCVHRVDTSCQDEQAQKEAQEKQKLIDQLDRSVLGLLPPKPDSKGVVLQLAKCF